jgi:hypothetical protein
VQDFADHFQTLAYHAPSVTAHQRADLFVGGLPDHICIDVEMHDPQDLQTAMYYARVRAARQRHATDVPGLRHARPRPTPHR